MTNIPNDKDQDLLDRLADVPTHPAEPFDPLKALGSMAPTPIDIDEISDMVGEVTRATGNPKDLIGDTKPDLSLVPQAFNLLVSQAMMDGARKYGPYNWRDNAVRNRVYIAAAMRHIAQYLDGEDIDPTSGVYHIGHAGACLAIIADALKTGNLIDDRPRAGPAGRMIRTFGEQSNFKED